MGAEWALGDGRTASGNPGVASLVALGCAGGGPGCARRRDPDDVGSAAGAATKSCGVNPRVTAVLVCTFVGVVAATAWVPIHGYMETESGAWLEYDARGVSYQWVLTGPRLNYQSQDCTSVPQRFCRAGRSVAEDGSAACSSRTPPA